MKRLWAQMRNREVAWLAGCLMGLVLSLAAPARAQGQSLGLSPVPSFALPSPMSPNGQMMPWRHWVIRLQASLQMNGAWAMWPRWYGNAPRCDLIFSYGGARWACLIVGYRCEFVLLGN